MASDSPANHWIYNIHNFSFKPKVVSQSHEDLLDGKDNSTDHCTIASLYSDRSSSQKLYNDWSSLQDLSIDQSLFTNRSSLKNVCIDSSLDIDWSVYNSTAHLHRQNICMNHIPDTVSLDDQNLSQMLANQEREYPDYLNPETSSDLVQPNFSHGNPSGEDITHQMSPPSLSLRAGRLIDSDVTSLSVHSDYETRDGTTVDQIVDTNFWRSVCGILSLFCCVSERSDRADGLVESYVTLHAHCDTSLPNSLHILIDTDQTEDHKASITIAKRGHRSDDGEPLHGDLEFPVQLVHRSLKHCDSESNSVNIACICDSNEKEFEVVSGQMDFVSDSTCYSLDEDTSEQVVWSSSRQNYVVTSVDHLCMSEVLHNNEAVLF